jgi:fluoroacetyl-CoA thioesterase
MDFTVNIGSTKERTIKVSSAQTTKFLWKGENVLSTPSMISEMEETCRLLLKEQHLAATPVGANVVFTAKVASANGRRVLFDVDANDSLERIGAGQHERFIINVPSFRDKFIRKQKQLAEL